MISIVNRIFRSTDGLSNDDIETQTKHYQSTAPSCLSPFHSMAVDLSSWNFDGHGEPLNSYWSISCKCGSDTLFIKAYSVINPDYSTTTPIIVSPITTECPKCTSSATLFDSNRDGYDPVACGESCRIYGPDMDGAAEFMHACLICGNTTHKVFVRFEYPGDLFDQEFGEAFRGREADLFTWFSCVTECAKCGAPTDLMSMECA